MAGKEIPYEESEVGNSQMIRSDEEGGGVSVGSAIASASQQLTATTAASNQELSLALQQQPQMQYLSLIPLHPAGKKQKLDAKPLPIVLGRTNLASWWWKSCPCQHYCRLHCRPVAQNIRSLSKVMIQVDTLGKIHLVGKNPHLVTLTPEREDMIVREHDIISVGRKDREPWMRFQVITRQPPLIVAPSVFLPPVVAPQQPAVPLAPQGMVPVGQPATQRIFVQAPAAASASNTRKSDPSNSNNKSARGSSNNNNASNNHQPQLAAAAAAALAGPRVGGSSTNPPEWITTTRKRKGTSTTNVSSGRHKNVQNNNNTSNADSDSANLFLRKRRRRHDKKGSSRSRSSRRHGKSGGDDAGTKARSPAPAEKKKDRHPQVHLVFQDYDISASLVRATQRNKKAAPQAQRAFPTDKSQLKLLSKNYAAAVFGAVHGSEPPPAPKIKSGRSSPTQQSAVNDRNHTMGGGGLLGLQVAVVAPSSAINQSNSSTKAIGDQTAGATVNEAANPPPHQQEPPCDHQDEASILSMPQCEEPSQADGSQLGDGEESNNKGQEDDKVPTQQPESLTPLYSSYEPGQGGPLSEAEQLVQAHMTLGSGHESWMNDQELRTSLDSWRRLQRQEEAQGNTSSFRHALASLVIAKNAVGEEGAEEGSPLWLPSLLHDIHPSGNK